MTRDQALKPTRICLDCGSLGYAGGYHDHGGGEAGDTCSIEQLRTSYVDAERRSDEALMLLEAVNLKNVPARQATRIREARRILSGEAA